MATRLAKAIRGSPQIEATQDWKMVASLQCARDLSLPSITPQRPPPPHSHPSCCGLRGGKTCNDGNVASFPRTLDAPMEKGWSLADLGTGNGILALAAKRFGAGRVIGIDIDPKAISVAKANARLNKIDDVDFQLADV